MTAPSAAPTWEEYMAPSLRSLMIRSGVGVQVRQRLEIVEIDEDFFE